MPRGWLTELSTSSLINAVLMEFGDSSAYDIWKKVRDGVKDAEKSIKRSYRLPPYNSVNAILRVCEKMGLVSVAGVQETSKHGPIKRKIYHMEKPDDERWENPLIAYYRPERFKMTRRSDADRKKHIAMLVETHRRRLRQMRELEER